MSFGVIITLENRFWRFLLGSVLSRARTSGGNNRPNFLWENIFLQKYGQFKCKMKMGCLGTKLTICEGFFLLLFLKAWWVYYVFKNWVIPFT